MIQRSILLRNCTLFATNKFDLELEGNENTWNLYQWPVTITDQLFSCTQFLSNAMQLTSNCTRQVYKSSSKHNTYAYINTFISKREQHDSFFIINWMETKKFWKNILPNQYILPYQKIIPHRLVQVRYKITLLFFEIVCIAAAGCMHITMHIINCLQKNKSTLL